MPLARPIELEINALEQEILALLARKDRPTDVVIAALADIMGRMAAALDREQDTVCPFEDRMESVMERAKQTYHRTLARAIAP